MPVGMKGLFRLGCILEYLIQTLRRVDEMCRMYTGTSSVDHSCRTRFLSLKVNATSEKITSENERN